MRRKKIFLATAIASILTCSLAGAEESFDVYNINSEPTSGGEASEFDMSVNLEVKKDINGYWMFGFYMPRTFNSLGSINPNLQMYIYDNASPKQKIKLEYVKKDLVKSNIPSYGDGYNNIFKSKGKFNLKKGHKYTVEFKQNNQWSPDNLSSMPQNFFFINGNGTIDTNQTDISAYADKNNVQDVKSIKGYNQADINKEIQKKLTDYQSTSIPIQSNSIVDDYNLIPTPMSISGNVSNKQIIDLTKGVFAPTSADDNVNFLREYLKEDGIFSASANLPDATDEKSASIVFSQDDNIKNKEGYKLDINNNKVVIKYKTNAGLFYGIQTLRNLYQKDNVVNKYQANKLELPEVNIEDAPRFEYRGVLIDSARHFFNINTFKTIIDAMSAQKLNTLHIHFSDDEGFRLGLESVNTDKADSRGLFEKSVLPAQMYQAANLDKSNYTDQTPSNILSLIDAIYPNVATKYSGTYSKEQIQEIISYANKHQITVIPEIDLPGHAKALVDSDQSTFIDPNDKSKYISVQGYYDDVMPVCLYNQDTAQAIKFTDTMNDIVKEIADLFDNQTTVNFESEVSVGGDEVSQDAWTNDSSCTSQKNLSALEKSHNFFKKLQKGSGIKLSGWQQAVQNDPVDGHAGGIGKYSMKPNKTGHIWVWNTFIEKWSSPEAFAQGAGLSESTQLAEKGYKTVFAYSSDTYFDLTYNPNAWEPGLYWATEYSDTHAALNSALDSKITVDNISKDKKSNIVGLEGTLWSENIDNSNHLYYMAFPKMVGLSEAAWSPESSTVDAPQSPEMNAKDYYNHYKINWNSLVERLGKDNDGYLGYLSNIINPNGNAQVVPYRGYPNGISEELPEHS